MQRGGMNDISGVSSSDTELADRRLDAAWADVEQKFEASCRTLSHNLPSDDDDDENYLGDVSIGGMKYGHGDELVSSESDITLQASNRTACSFSSSSPFPIHANYGHQTKESMANSNQTLIQKYRAFLQKNQTSLDLIEHIMERFVFYGHLFKHDHTGISTEMYYAAWNILRWMNDVVLEGWGEGIGMTVGTRGDLIQEQGSSSKTLYWNFNSAVPLIRAIVTATTCIYPAMEAWTRRSLYFRPLYGTPLINNVNDQQHGRQLDWEMSQYRAAQVSYRLERVRFVARLALLSISWWAQYRRRRCSNAKDGDERRKMLFVPSLLKRGGELDPCEQPTPLREAEKEAKIMQYVGRRTGRRSVPLSPSRYCASPCVSNSSTFTTWLSRINTSKNRILYFYAVGELLHILRPLYWSHAEKIQWQCRFSPENVFQKQRTVIATSTYSSWKAWWISLSMDVISDKLLQITNDGNITSQRKKGAMGHHSHRCPPSAECAQLQELDQRRSRLMLYLLRSPTYDTVTCPLTKLIGKIVSRIPSFGLARWASEYILEMMSYWNSHRFMLES